MGNVEILIQLEFPVEILFVKAVGNQFHRSGGHGLEILLDHRRDRDYPGSSVQYFFFQLVMLFLRSPGKTQMFEIEHLRPRIPEVGNPGQPGCLGQFQADEMHTLRRTGGYYSIYRVAFKVLFQETDGGMQPEDRT